MARNTAKVERCVKALRWGLGRLTRNSITHIDLYKPKNTLVSAQLEHFWCTDEPRANMDSQNSPWPGLRGSHHLPLYNILSAWPWGKHPNVILSQYSQVGVPKFPKLGLLQLWMPIIYSTYFWSKLGFKKSIRPRQDLSNDMCHTTCMQGNQGDFWFLVVESQINNLTPNLSFGHNLCFRYPNGSCEPILKI